MHALLESCFVKDALRRASRYRISGRFTCDYEAFFGQTTP
jgi:hypothetical protein